MTKTLRVGIIGVNAERGWAREGHVPAVQSVGGLELFAVAAGTQQAAEAAQAACGAERAYGDAADLVADPDVDIVTVAAPVPAHRDLIIAALSHGKHVMTEWPVGTSTRQTQEIAAAGAARGLHTAVGLQARMNPAATRAMELLAEGAVGRVLSAAVYSSTAGFGRVVPENQLYLEKPESNMNLLTIQTAHTLDLAIMIAGPLTSLAALTTTQYPDLEAGDPPRPYRRTVPDHVLVQGRLADGGALAAQIAGGRPADDTPFRMEVVGERGVLVLAGGAPRGFQSGVLSLLLDNKPVEIDGDGVTAALPGPAVNVARMYAALRDDIRHDRRTAPDFQHAVQVSQLIDDILASASAGRTTAPTAAWP